MVFHDLLKHQSLSKVCSTFVKRIGKKYNNNITAGEYIVERFIEKQIRLGYSSKHNYHTPFFKIAAKYNNFDIVVNSYDETAGYCALSYAKHTENIGLIFTTSTSGVANIHTALTVSKYSNIPILLMSFYDKELDSESKLVKFAEPEIQCFKENVNITKAENLPNMLEYIMILSELPKKGPVYLNICNNILKKKIDLDRLRFKDNEVLSEKIIPDDTELSLLQYYEKKYEEYEEYDKMHEQEIKNYLHK
jgi:thiamine pyrophosphate-dependent acetolactate synthase large subunit-like protein